MFSFSSSLLPAFMFFFPFIIIIFLYCFALYFDCSSWLEIFPSIIIFSLKESFLAAFFLLQSQKFSSPPDAERRSNTCADFVVITKVLWHVLSSFRETSVFFLLDTVLCAVLACAFVFTFVFVRYWSYVRVSMLLKLRSCESKFVNCQTTSYFSAIKILSQQYAAYLFIRVKSKSST